MIDPTMVADPIDVFITFVGIMVCPELTFCVILWMLGHPILGLLAFFNSDSKKIVKKIFIDTRTNQVIREES